MEACVNNFVIHSEAENMIEVFLQQTFPLWRRFYSLHDLFYCAPRHIPVTREKGFRLLEYHWN